MISREKAQRLEQIARLYYEQNKTQQEIAARLGVSRPLISRMLQEARDEGIVEIRIHSRVQTDGETADRAQQRFHLSSALLLPDHPDDRAANQALAQAAMNLVRALGGGRVGLGWGHIIGTVVELLEQRSPQRDVITHVCPMVGNSGISIRNYHSNENVRIVAHHTMATPHYLHTPAFAETSQELELLRQTEHYKAVLEEWERLDIALVNIGNHPSTPDFASVARYGSLLTQRQAVGRLIAYYYDINGEIIHSDGDYAVQIPLPLLAKSRNVVGVCSANVSWRALGGALRTGLFTHVVARESVMRQVLEEQ